MAMWQYASMFPGRKENEANVQMINYKLALKKDFWEAFCQETWRETKTDSGWDYIVGIFDQEEGSYMPRYIQVLLTVKVKISRLSYHMKLLYILC